jgi:hypothetical protein
MTCAEFKDKIELWALGALDEKEAAEMEAHLAGGVHEGCQGVSAATFDAAALIGLALPPVAPDARLWRRIAARIGRGAQAAMRPREWAAWLLAAAALLLLVWMWQSRGTLELALEERGRSLQAAEGEAQRLAQAQQLCRAALELERRAVALAARPGTQVVALAEQTGAAYRAVAWFNPGEQRALVVATGVEPPAGKDLELWLIRDGKKLPAGLLRGGADGRAIVEVPGELMAGGSPDAFAVTLEPVGGVPQPTGPVVLVGSPRRG